MQQLHQQQQQQHTQQGGPELTTLQPSLNQNSGKNLSANVQHDY